MDDESEVGREIRANQRGLELESHWGRVDVPGSFVKVNNEPIG